MKKLLATILVILLCASTAYARVNEVTARNDYTGNGSVTAYTYSFRIVDKTHIEVIVNNVTKVVDSDYTVGGVGADTGTITFTVAPTNGHKITFLRKQPLAQTTDYVPGVSLSADRIEQDLDKLVMIAQQLYERQGRTITMGTQSTLSGITIPDPGASQYLRWNAAGTALEAADVPSVVGSAIAAITGSTKAGLGVSDAAGTLRRVTDDVQGLWMSKGTGYYSLFYQTVNVHEFAVCDGTTDDTAAVTSAMTRASALSRGAAVIIGAGDCRIAGNLTVPSDVTLVFQQGGRLKFDNATTQTINGHIWTFGNYGIFEYGATTTVTIAPTNIINPVWFAQSGDGSAASPWAATDGTFLKHAWAALQEYGAVRVPGGEYTVSVAGAGFGKESVIVECHTYANINVTQDVVVIDIHNNSDTLGTNVVRNVRWRGCKATGSAASKGTFIKAYDIRNLTISDVYCINQTWCMDVVPRDTVRIVNNHFSGTGTGGIRIPAYYDNSVTLTSQDIDIAHNYFASGTATYTAIKIEDRVVALRINNNSFNLPPGAGTTKCLDFVTGGSSVRYGSVAGAESADFYFRFNTVENMDAQTCIAGTTANVTSDLESMFVDYNEVLSAVTFISVTRMDSINSFSNNRFTNAGATGIVVTSLRPSATLFIKNNDLPMTSTSSGVLWNITSAQSTAKVIFEANKIATASIGTRTVTVNKSVVYRAMGRIETDIASAATIVIPPHVTYAHITGTTNIDTINSEGVNGTGCWDGHTIILSFNASLTVNDASNLKMAGNFSATADDTLTLVCKDNNWLEVSRSAN